MTAEYRAIKDQLDDIAEKVDKIDYRLRGNGEPGLTENVRSLDKRVSDIEQRGRDAKSVFLRVASWAITGMLGAFAAIWAKGGGH